jgi:succinyl-CoA synthetase alpha subunit
MGTCASIFPYEVQFGHAGAMARGNLETAVAKNAGEENASVPSAEVVFISLLLLFVDGFFYSLLSPAAYTPSFLHQFYNTPSKSIHIAALKEAGAHVPRSFDAIGEAMYEVYAGLVAEGTIIVKPEPPTPKVGIVI